MSIKYVEFTVPGIVDCSSCSCKEVYVCLGSAATVTLVSGETVFPGTLSESVLELKNIGNAVSTDTCCNTVTNAVFYPYSKITIKYDSDLLTDSEDAVSTGDIACVSTDSCAVAAARAGL